LWDAGKFRRIMTLIPLFNKKAAGKYFYRNVRHEAAQKMREGPSKSACRSRLQTA
jgi:hypothetical protein